MRHGPAALSGTPFGFERILRGRMIESPNEYKMGAGFGHKL
jgi:hypothetical protein